MLNKPSTLAEAQKGVIAGTQSGYCDTFNWMKDLLDALTPMGYSVGTMRVVTGLEYDAESHEFKATFANLAVIEVPQEAGKSDEETVFTATPYTGE